MAAEASGRYLINGAGDGRPTLVLAHGAGAAMDHPWMDRICALIAAQGVRTVRFEFPYMAVRRISGRRPGPNPARVLEATWREVVEELGAEGLVVGGKSMGGRIASMVAEEAGVAGVVCFGYPFHPPGRPEKLRTAHLEAIETPVLIVQGERDTFGRPEEVAGYDSAGPGASALDGGRRPFTQATQVLGADGGREPGGGGGRGGPVRGRGDGRVATQAIGLSREPQASQWMTSETGGRSTRLKLSSPVK